MHLLATLPLAQVELYWDIELTGSPRVLTRQLRGAIAHAFADDDLFHQHDPATGKPIYRYPRIQYRWGDGCGRIIGWGQAAQRLLALPWLDLGLIIGHQPVTIDDVALTSQQADFAVSARLLRYRLIKPALLFNQDNYQHYRTLAESERPAEQDRLLTANLLGTMRGLDVTFPERLYATFTDRHSKPSRYKDEKFLGLTGEFITNAVLPDGLAIGHAVSHGYGVLQRA